MLHPHTSSLHTIDLNPERPTAVLLLHGLGADGSSWGLQFEALSGAGWRILAPDLPGFGKSPPLQGRVTIPKLAAAVQSFLHTCAVESAHVVGISMGGIIGLQLALDHPEAVGRLVLVNAAAHLRPSTGSTWIYYLLRLLMVYTLGIPRQARLVSQRIFPGPDQAMLRETLYRQITQADPGAYRQTMLALGLFDVRSRLPLLKAPTLVVTGQNDDTIPIERQRQMVTSIPGARHSVLPDAGHGVIADQPQRFNQELLNFLKEDSN